MFPSGQPRLGLRSASIRAASPQVQERGNRLWLLDERVVNMAKTLVLLDVRMIRFRGLPSIREETGVTGFFAS